MAEEEEEDAINEEAEALAEEIVAEKEEAELDQLDEQLAAQQSAEEIMVEENTEAEVEAELEAEAEDEAAEDAEDEDSEGQEDSMETVQDIGEDDVVVVVDMPTVDNGIVEIVTVVPENAFDGVAATDIDGANPDLVNLVATGKFKDGFLSLIG